MSTARDYCANNGLCPQCGGQTHKKGFFGKLKPLNIPGRVEQGRCISKGCVGVESGNTMSSEDDIPVTPASNQSPPMVNQNQAPPKKRISGAVLQGAAQAVAGVLSGDLGAAAGGVANMAGGMSGQQQSAFGGGTPYGGDPNMATMMALQQSIAASEAQAFQNLQQALNQDFQATPNPYMQQQPSMPQGNPYMQHSNMWNEYMAASQAQNEQIMAQWQQAMAESQAQSEQLMAQAFGTGL